MEAQDIGFARTKMIAKGVGGQYKETNKYDTRGLDDRALGTICLCLEDKILFDNTQEETTKGL